MVFFLWKGIFTSNTSVFGYDQTQMFTYVFMVLIVQTIVLSAPSADNIGSEIASGDLSNYLLKPISYLKFWFTRDLASKLLNFIFGIFEVSLLFLTLKPQIQLPASHLNLVAFVIALILAMLLYFFIATSIRFLAFWSPDNTWPLAFLAFILIEILAGGVFPLDILPSQLRFLLELTPFPYLLYFPIAIWLGKVSGLSLLQTVISSLAWVVLSFKLNRLIWQQGLKVYAAEGR